MEINLDTRINDLLDEYPYLVDFLQGVSPKFKKLTNPFMRKTLGRIATIEKAAMIEGLEPEELLLIIGTEVRRRSETSALPPGSVHMIKAPSEKEERKEVLKGIIRDLHQGEDMEVLKKRFSHLIEDVEPSEIAEMEQSLIDEGMPGSEVKRLCDVHVQVFKDSLDEKEVPVVEPGHPVHTFMRENHTAEDIMGIISSVLGEMGEPVKAEAFKKRKEEVVHLLEQLREIDKHYLRKENQLFPLLESKGASGPSSVMWEIHDDIRAQFKASREMMDKGNWKGAHASIQMLLQMVKDMIYKEENILFPMSLEKLGMEDWVRVRRGEEEIGYSWGGPGGEWPPTSEDSMQGGEKEKTIGDGENRLSLDRGELSLEMINLMLKHLPVDLSFVDERDEVAYYSDVKERIFPRSPGVIGRKVQKCHPPSSVHMVQKIVDEFRAGRRDSAEFWIQLKGRFLYIRYFAVRDDNGRYRGTLEVSQDISELRKLEGQRRLLDWDQLQ